MRTFQYCSCGLPNMRDIPPRGQGLNVNKGKVVIQCGSEGCRNSRVVSLVRNNPKFCETLIASRLHIPEGVPRRKRCCLGHHWVMGGIAVQSILEGRSTLSSGCLQTLSNVSLFSFVSQHPVHSSDPSRRY